MILTYKCRIKDSNSRKALCALSSKVNFVWNYVNEINIKSFAKFKQDLCGKFLSAFDINNLLAGTSKWLCLHAQTIQHISETYVSCRKTANKPCPVREWSCSFCYAKHDRDVNSAKSILRIGHNTQFLAKQEVGNPLL